MIFISTGHHKHRQGASFQGHTEYAEASRWVEVLDTYLGESSQKIPTGVLSEKVTHINRSCKAKKGDHLAIEIHFNSDPARAGKGCETLYYPGSKRGKEVAESLQESMSVVFTPDRGAKEGWYRMHPDNGPNFFLARTACTAIILEPEFIHNIEKIQANRLVCCRQLASALRKYS